MNPPEIRVVDQAEVPRAVSAQTMAFASDPIMRWIVARTARDAFDIFPLDATVLERAAEPFPTLLSSLDAIHLAIALLARARVDDLYFATHDDELGTAAQAMGFEVLGLSPVSRRRSR